MGNIVQRWTLVFLLLIAAWTSSLAQLPPAVQKCTLAAADKNWSATEQTTWDHICAGEDVIFDKSSPSGDNYPEGQLLRPIFIETILLKDPWRKAVTRRGVRIIGARFDKVLDLSNAKVEHDLVFMQCQLDGGVDFSGMTATQGVTIINSRVAWIDMGGARISMDVDLRGDRVGSRETNYGTAVSIDFEGAEIGGTLDLGNGSDDLAGDEKKNFELEQKKDASYRTKFRAEISSEIRASGIKVKHAVYLNNTSAFKGNVDISFAIIGESLSLAGGSFDEDVDANGAQIGSELTLSYSQDGDASWAQSSRLNLHNAHADSVPGFSYPWPKHLDLSGFVYRNIDESSEASPDTIDAWFRRQDEYAEQPYEQLAQVLQSRGSIEMAKEVRFLSRERVREESHGWTWFWQTILWLLIGYGYYPQWAILPIGFMVACGVAVLAVSGQGRANGLPYGIAYSFDMLLPIIKLREKHYEIDLKGWARYYFYAHKIAGWALASFLVAVLAGLTK